jgi:hypothetical protein
MSTITDPAVLPGAALDTLLTEQPAQARQALADVAAPADHALGE